jgi:hypothetical protein
VAIDIYIDLPYLVFTDASPDAVIKPRLRVVDCSFKHTCR